jgi:hypothetical protein
MRLVIEPIKKLLLQRFHIKNYKELFNFQIHAHNLFLVTWWLLNQPG